MRSPGQNICLPIIFSQLYSANYLQPIIFSQCTWQWYWVGGNYFTSGCRLSVGWPFASSSVLKVRRTAKCFRWSPTWATSAVWQLIDNWYMWRKIVCLYRPAWPGWRLHPALLWCPLQWAPEPHSLHHLWKYTHEVSQKKDFIHPAVHITKGFPSTCDEDFLHPATDIEKAVFVLPTKVSWVNPALEQSWSYYCWNWKCESEPSPGAKLMQILQLSNHLRVDNFLGLLLVPEVSKEHVPAPRTDLSHSTRNGRCHWVEWHVIDTFDPGWGSSSQSVDKICPRFLGACQGPVTLNNCSSIAFCFWTWMRMHNDRIPWNIWKTNYLEAGSLGSSCLTTAKQLHHRHVQRHEVVERLRDANDMSIFPISSKFYGSEGMFVISFMTSILWPVTWDVWSQRRTINRRLSPGWRVVPHLSRILRSPGLRLGRDRELRGLAPGSGVEPTSRMHLHPAHHL